MYIINTYQLSGLDIDYEAGTNDPTFVSVFGQVLNNVFAQLGGPNSGFDFSYSPFGQTAPDYQNLYFQKQSTNVFITYQAYDNGSCPDFEYQNCTVDGYVSFYAGLAQTYNNDYGLLGLGICSNTSAPRGLQPPDIYTALADLQVQGLQVVSIFSLEDSANNGYPIERTLLSDFAKKDSPPPNPAA